MYQADAKEDDPHVAEVHYRGEGIRMLEEAARLEPQNPEHAYWLGMALENRGELVPALARYRRALELDPENPELYVRVASIEMSEGRLDDTEELLDGARELLPDDYRLTFLYGRLREEQGRLEEAREQYERAAELAPAEPQTYARLADVLTRLGRAAEGERMAAEFERWSTLNARLNYWLGESKRIPRDPTVLARLGGCYLDRDDLDQAQQYLGRALTYDRGHFLAQANMGRLLHRRGQAAEALHLLESAARAPIKDPETQREVVARLQGEAFPEGARKVLETSIELEPDEPELHYDLGILCLKTQEFDEALEHFTKTLELDPEHIDARVGLAGILYTREDWAAAAEQYRQILELEPEHVLAQQLLAAAESSQEG